MNLLMSFTLSLVLSLVGTLNSGHFTVPGFLVSFLISMVISLVVGVVIPMRPLTGKVNKKLGLAPGSMKERAIDSLVSDLVYTPIMSIAMISMAHEQAVKNGADIPFVPMLLRSLCISLAVGYVLIFVFMPIYLKLLVKKFAPGRPGGPQNKPEK